MRRAFRACAVILLGAAAACGGDSTGPSSGGFDQAIAMQIGFTLFTDIMQLSLGAFPWGLEGAAVGDDVPVAAATMSVEQVVPCVGGGSIAVNGTMANDLDPQGSGSLSIAVSQKPSACKISTTQGVFSVDGNPSLNVNGNIEANGFEPTRLTVAYSGGYKWVGSGSSGTCNMDLTFRLDYSDPNDVEMSGTMCGYSF